MVDSLSDYCQQFAAWVFDETLDILATPFNQNNRFYWVFLVSALVLAAFSYRRYYRGEGTLSFRDFLKFVFPKRIYLHPSAIMDYKIFASYHFIAPLMVGPVAEGLSAAVVASYVNNLLTATLPSSWQGLPITFWTMLAFTLLYALLSDFVTYINHRIHHEMPLLWPIHRVHHSAEVLTPFTYFRKHPLYSVVRIVINTPVMGAFQGMVIFLFLGTIDLVSILGINAAAALFRILGANLRHSHIWLSYGPILNYVFVSPAHHQVHHSARPEHWNRNYGEIFAIWDWIFGTLVLPSEAIRKTLVFGVRMGEPQHHPTLVKAYLEPLESIYRIIRHRLRSLRA